MKIDKRKDHFQSVFVSESHIFAIRAGTYSIYKYSECVISSILLFQITAYNKIQLIKFICSMGRSLIFILTSYLNKFIYFVLFELIGNFNNLDFYNFILHYNVEEIRMKNT